MRVRPWLEPRALPGSNCSTRVTSSPRSLNAHAVAQPITPAPMMVIRATAVSLSDVVPKRADHRVRQLDAAAGANGARAASDWARDHIAGEEARVQLREVE